MSETFQRDVIAQRTAEVSAAFLLPHLRAGMSLLDVGCGPGSITVGLAARVAPGAAVGVDLNPADLDKAASAAHAAGAANLRLSRSDLYQLPFAEASFDVAFAHSVLEHLADPLGALRELRRVLRPGGIAAIADPAWHQTLRYPSNQWLEKWDTLRPRAVERRGGHPLYVAEQRALLRAAGFARTVGGAMPGGSVRGDGPAGTAEQTRAIARAEIARLRDDFSEVALAEGWLTQSELDVMAQSLADWGDHPDAYLLRPICCALGFV